MAANITFRLTGGASNSDPDASLGGVGSSQEVSATPLNNLFDDVDAGEASAGDVEYRAIDLYNGGDQAAVGVELYISTETPNANTQIDVALDSTTQSIADESTAPTGVTFSHPLTGSRLSVSDIAVGSTQRVWLRRTVSASAPNLANDNFQLSVEYA
jgi:hypothetical protein